MGIKLTPWKLERSDDGKQWIKVIALYDKGIATRTFDVELELNRYKFIRLVDPDGVVQERASKRQKEAP